MNRHNFQISLILLIMFFTFVVNNGFPDANIMECRNLTTAREILHKGNWLQPTMNGELRLEKPPLPTWISAFTMLLFGQDNMAWLRLPSALAAMLLIFFLFKLTREVTDDKDLPFITAGTAATSFYIFFMARDISWDIFCHSFMLGAICFIHRALKRDDHCWKEFIAAGILMGLSFLSKGPISFYTLLLPYLIIRIAVYGWKGLSAKKYQLTVMIFITLLSGLWWPIYIWFKHPDFSALVAFKESDAWLNRSTKPFYHYWSFPVQSGIWTVMATAALVFPYARKRINQFYSYWFAAGWVWIAVILLSLFPEKKERYLLPAIIPLSLLTAGYARYLIEAFKNNYKLRIKNYELRITKADSVLFWINGILITVVSAGIPFLAILFLRGKEMPGSLHLILLFIGFLIFALLLIGALINKKPLIIWGGMAGLVMFSCLVLLPIMPGIMQTNPDFKSYKELRYRADLKNLPFYFDGEIPGKFIEVIWNCGHEVKKWNPDVNSTLPVDPPFVFMTHEQPDPARAGLRQGLYQRYEIEMLGHYDGNRETKRGNEVLSNWVVLIKSLKCRP